MNERLFVSRFLLCESTWLSEKSSRGTPLFRGTDLFLWLPLFQAKHQLHIRIHVTPTVSRSRGSPLGLHRPDPSTKVSPPSHLPSEVGALLDKLPAFRSWPRRFPNS
jgi:hypothetical protein